MSLKVLEAKWKPALSSILEELTDPELSKLLFNLVKIPKGLKTGKTREEIPDLIVQYYGTEGSISEIDKIMKMIPRNDAAVQEPLRPFVEKLKKQRQGKKGTTRKLSIDFGSVAKKQKLTADQLKSCPPVQVRETKTDPGKAAKPKKKKEKRDPSLEHQPSASASTNVDPVGDVETGKKTEDRDSSLKPAKSIRTFKMDPVGDMKPEQKTEGQDASLKPAVPSKTFKGLSAEVQTGRIQIVEIKKSNKTNIHLLVELNGKKKKVFLTNQLLANALGVEVEEDVERRLRYQMPLTAEATLQGRQITAIKQMDPVGDMKPEQKTEGQDASLKPAAPPKTSKGLSAAAQTGRIQIVGIKKSNKTNTHLVVEFNGRKRTVFVRTRLLANAFGLEVDDGFERRLRYQMPLTAEATLQGRQITAIKQMDPVGDMKPEQKTEGQDASLKPAAPPKTSKVLSAEVQTGRIQIVGIKKSNKTNTHLVVEFNGRKRTVFVRTRLLANAFGLEVDDGFERSLRYQMPLTAEAKLHGKKVTEIKKTRRIQIMGIKPSENKSKELVVEFNDQMHTFLVKTRLLASAFGLQADERLDRELRYQMPLPAEATLHGNKITDIKKV